ncbi:MAG: MFS transporter [Verrucomicrobiota bacterium]
MSLFGSFHVLLPVFAKDILQTGASGFGYLMAAHGTGAFLGALTLASTGNSPHRRKFFYGGLFGWNGMMIVFAYSHVYWLSAATLVVAGFCMMFFFATANTGVQSRVPDALRGRVMGIYSFAFIGLSPFGSLLAGWLAQVTSAPFTVTLGASICLIAGLIGMRRMTQQPEGAK